ncbi:MAG: glycosyltransferase family 2 protein [Nanoarchaeota archaeon]|nr:glycosyltransferase family 2 protein [Nanoarchaeota archaeon]
MHPKISIVIAAYNEEKHIKDCINSILDQSFKDFEIIVADDCSSDKTAETIKSISLKNPKVKPIFLKENRGRSQALNEGIKKAQGKYIAFIDGDDLMAPERLEKQHLFLENNPEISLVYSDFVQFGEDREEKMIKSVEFKENPLEIIKNSYKKNLPEDTMPSQILHEKDFIPGGSVMLRKKIFDEDISLDPELRNSEDYDLWLQIIGHGFQIAKIPIIAFRYRRHENQKSKNPEKMKIAARHILEKFREGKYFKS